MPEVDEPDVVDVRGALGVEHDPGQDLLTLPGQKQGALVTGLGLA